MGNLVRKVIFTPMGYMNPNSGGMYVLEQHMEFLKTAGYDIHILYSSNDVWNAFYYLSYKYPSIGFNGDSNSNWLLASTEDKIKVLSPMSKNDIVIISEEFAWYGIKELIPRNINYLIINQGISATFYSNYEPAESIREFYQKSKGVLVNSDHTALGVQKIFKLSDKKILRFKVGVDDKIFKSSTKNNTICYSTQKNGNIATFVEKYLRLNYSDLGIIRIDNATRSEFANILSKSKIYMSFGGPEGFGLPPIEAAFSGCRVIGFDGYGGAEYFREPTFVKVNQHDHLDFLDKIDNVITDINNESLYDEKYVQILREKYSLANARETITKIFSNIE